MGIAWVHHFLRHLSNTH